MVRITNVPIAETHHSGRRFAKSLIIGALAINMAFYNFRVLVLHTSNVLCLRPHMAHRVHLRASYFPLCARRDQLFSIICYYIALLSISLFFVCRQSFPTPSLVAVPVSLSLFGLDFYFFEKILKNCFLVFSFFNFF